ncbi:MAG: hypothetical protein H3C35_05680 [Bacteroidetes bacterium]|nr:hypothetical protein [Bacteroidota bacterium]
MKCREFHDCVCEIIDKRLSDERKKELMEHAYKCPHCGYELNALSLASKTVKEKVHKQQVPADVYYSIMQKTSEAKKGFFTSRSSLFRLRSFNPVVAFIIVLAFAVGVYSFFLPVKPHLSDERNIISQSIKNYQAVIGGSIKPQFEDDIDNVKTILSKEVPFDVNVPKLTGCRKCGGILSIFKGVKLAHVVYNVEGNIVYIYQTDMNDAMKGKVIGLPNDVKNDLEKNGRYIKETSAKETIVLWNYKNTLCAAVSRLPKERLLSLLSHQETEK